MLAQCKWLRDQIAVWERQAKGVISRELEGGERTNAVAADGTVIGSGTRAEGARSMQIDNEEGFLMWVKSRYPHEVVETVRPAFVKLAAEKVKVLGALPDETLLYPGHNYADRPRSTLGDEKRTNMMMRFRTLGDFLSVMGGA